jgi:hypothetical protein
MRGTDFSAGAKGADASPLTDIDLGFKTTVLRAVEPFVEEEEVVKPTMDDRNKTFRTRFICVWLLMNAVREYSNVPLHHVP